MREFTYTQDDVYRYEFKIKCLCVAFDGTFYARIIPIFTHKWTNVQSIVDRWNIGAATHKVINGHKLPLYQYSLVK